MDASLKGIFRHQYFKEIFSYFGCVACETGIFPGIQADLTDTPSMILEKITRRYDWM
jgi:hypothetical protein